MKLFDILQGGFHTPLSAVQIVGLFDAGGVDRQTESTPVQRTQWLTIDALFPIMNSDTSREFVGRSAGVRNSFRLSLSAALALVPLGAVATVVIGCFFFSPRSSMASPIVTSTGSPAALTSSVSAKKQPKNSPGQRRSSSAEPARSRR